MQDLVHKALARIWFDGGDVGGAIFGGGVDIHEIGLEARDKCGGAGKDFEACTERIG